MVPDRVWVPVVRMRLPVPEMAPAKVSLALLSVSVLLPNTTEPALLPARPMMVAPVVVPLISKMALLVKPLEVAIEPVPVKAKVPPLIVVVPV